MQIRHRYSKRLLLTLALLLAMVALLTPASASAQGPGPDDKIVWGGSYTLPAGKTLDGNLVVFGGAAQVEKDAVVNGDVSVIGGTVDINGKINGNIVALGGVITLGDDAFVNGDATAIGGLINRAPGAMISGNVVETNERQKGIHVGPDGVQITPIPPSEFQNFPVPAVRPDHKPTSLLTRMLLAGFSAIAWTAIMAALGVFAILLAPKHIERMALAIQDNLILSFAVGLAAMLIVVPLITVLAITICLIPVAVVIPFLLMAAWMLGWLSMGWLFGKELLKAANAQNITPVWEVIVGVAILTLLWKLPQVMPFIGGVASWLVLFIAGNIALGGALLTRFGSRPYPAQAIPAPTPGKALAAESSLSGED